jgi:hypothetical protein
MGNRDPHVDLRGEMADELGPEILDQGSQRVRLSDADLVHGHLRGHAARPAGRHVVDDGDVVAAGDEGIGEMRPDETGTTGDEHAHGEPV